MARQTPNSLLNSLKGKIWIATSALAFFVCTFGLISYLIVSFVVNDTFYAIFLPFLLLALTVMAFGWWLSNEVVHPIEKVSLLAKSMERSALTSLPKTSGSTETDDLLEMLHRNSQQIQKLVNLMDEVSAGNTDVALTPLQNSGSLKTVQGTLNERASVIKNALLGYISGDNADPDGISTGPPPAPGYRADWRRLPFADRATGGVCTGIANNGAADPDCTQGNIPWGTLGIAQTTATDPWGQFFRYTVTVDLAGAGTEPGGTGGMMLNSPAAATVAYTLVSAGADSTFGSADDVTLLSISVGELRGTLNNAGVPVDP